MHGSIRGIGVQTVLGHLGHGHLGHGHLGHGRFRLDISATDISATENAKVDVSAITINFGFVMCACINV